MRRDMAECGYNVVVQDVRGCLDSKGEFDILVGEDVEGRAAME